MATWQQQNPGKCARCSVKLASYDSTLPPVCDRCSAVGGEGTAGDYGFLETDSDMLEAELSDGEASVTVSREPGSTTWRAEVSYYDPDADDPDDPVDVVDAGSFEAADVAEAKTKAESLLDKFFA
jgi:hypothetical protein